MQQQQEFKRKMDAKQIKGVQESIFETKFRQLNEFLDTISDENW